MKTYGQYFTTDKNGIQVFNPFDYLDFYEANIHSYNIYIYMYIYIQGVPKKKSNFAHGSYPTSIQKTGKRKR